MGGRVGSVRGMMSEEGEGVGSVSVTVRELGNAK